MRSLQKYQAGILVAILASSSLSAGLFLTISPSWAQSDTVKASVVAGSSSRTTDAYQPNPVEVSVGQTVVWTNDDSTPHTVTSGSAGTPDGKFDSSPNFNPLMAPQQTFSHTFEEAGEFPYYCALHPNMVGTVIVSQQAPSAGQVPDQEPDMAQGNLSQGQPVANNISTPTLEEAKQSYLSAWNNTAFNASFSTYIEENSALGYGVYEGHASDNVFRPGEIMALYVEPVGFGHMPVIDQAGSTLYLINMTADYVISDDQGNELQRIPNIPAGNIISHRQNTELFLELTLTQETPFPEGDYAITYIVHDNVSGEGFEIIKNVSIAGAAAQGTGTEESSSNFDGSLDMLDDVLDDNEGSNSDENTSDRGPSADSGSSSSQEEEEIQTDDEENNDCDSAYPDTCIPPPPPDLDCGDVSERNFEVGSSDPHGFDGDNDGIGCEN